MKKAIVLLSGIFLVTGNIFADEKLDFLGTTVKVQELISSSEKQSKEYNDSNWGTEALLRVNYKIDDKNTLSFKYEVDDDDNSDEDNQVRLLLKRKDGPIEAQFALDLGVDGTNKDIQEVQDTNETYVKYQIKDDILLSVYPFNMGFETGKYFSDYEDNMTEIPGIVLSKGKFDLGLGIDQASWPKENVYAIKANYEFDIFGTNIKTNYSKIMYDQNKLHPKDTLGGSDTGHLGIVTQIADITLNKKITDKFMTFAEFAHNRLDRNTLKLKDQEGNYKFVNSGMAGIIGAEYQLTEKFKPYANVKYVTDGFLGYWRENEKNTPTNKVDQGSWVDSTGTTQYWDLETMTGLKTGGIMEYVVGVDYEIYSNLVLNLEGQYASSGKKVFRGNQDSTNLATDWDTKTKNNYFQVTVGAKYTF